MEVRRKTTAEWIEAYEPKPGEARPPESEIPPIDPAVIPNYMGINLCSVEFIAWERRDDGQLVSMCVGFLPSDLPSIRSRAQAEQDDLSSEAA